jgi:hypothetical protein
MKIGVSKLLKKNTFLDTAQIWPVIAADKQGQFLCARIRFGLKSAGLKKS